MNSATRRFVTQWKFEILIGGLVWLVYFVHVVPGGGVNPNRYFDLTHSIVNHKVLNIDEYQENTIDKAYKDGHYYSVGLPGPSLAAIPAYFVFKAIYSLLPDSWLEQISTVQSYKQGTSGFYLQDTTDFFLSTDLADMVCIIAGFSHKHNHFVSSTTKSYWLFIPNSVVDCTGVCIRDSDIFLFNHVFQSRFFRFVDNRMFIFIMETRIAYKRWFTFRVGFFLR